MAEKVFSEREFNSKDGRENKVGRNLICRWWEKNYFWQELNLADDWKKHFFLEMFFRKHVLLFWIFYLCFQGTSSFGINTPKLTNFLCAKLCSNIKVIHNLMDSVLCPSFDWLFSLILILFNVSSLKCTSFCKNLYYTWYEIILQGFNYGRFKKMPTRKNLHFR